MKRTAAYLRVSSDLYLEGSFYYGKSCKKREEVAMSGLLAL